MIGVLKISAAILCALLVVSVELSASSRLAGFAVGVAFVLGWTVSELNALRTREELWPALERVIDWVAVEEVLTEGEE